MHLHKITSNDLNFFQIIFHDTVLNSRISEMQDFIQHGTTSCLLHCIAVAYISYRISTLVRFIRCRKEDIIRGALLHDYFLYDWHENDKSHRLHGFSHPYTALRNAEEDFSLTPTEKDIIKKHMFQLTIIPPKSTEAYIVSIVDKACSVYEIFKRSNAYPSNHIQSALRFAKKK